MEHVNNAGHDPPFEDDPLDQVPMDDAPVDVELYDMADVADFSWHVVLRVHASRSVSRVHVMPQCLGAMSFAMKTKRWRCRRILEPWNQDLNRIPRSTKPLGVVIAEEEISIEACVYWYNYCRELCSSEILRSPMVKWFGVVTGADRTKPTLSHLIKKHIAPGTHIISDKFGSYISSNERHTLVNNTLLANQDYYHDWVNHSENFVNPQNGAHTQSIEGVWEIRIERFAKAMRGMHRPHLPLYLDEYLWRSWYFPLGSDGKMYFKGLL
ncbi:hypothetical protein H257_00214 [Aphanomyces astaci]|uniref:ISXO2-like transposase domain-containing protein n=1 Tax=Aphanomyces astaci TaxID=112090 RepID=W4H9U7_APHAT|nr:hypothetical protein H257_00214 [Aphanomyces astaci]ETV88692.1 hypothetical protein H257_00214 [Aphanomyces astaci]|eukprot:XP_009821092.1 hypothetical protein H257_00214 [Aphanomyces astaci]